MNGSTASNYTYTSVDAAPEEDFPPEQAGTSGWSGDSSWVRSGTEQVFSTVAALARRLNLKKSLNQRPWIFGVAGAILLFLVVMRFTRASPHHDAIHDQVDSDIIAEADRIDHDHGLEDSAVADLVPVRDGKKHDGTTLTAHMTTSETADGTKVVSTAIESNARKVGLLVHELASDSRLEAEHMLASVRADHVHAKVFHRLRGDNEYPFNVIVLPELQKGHMTLSADQRRGIREWVLELGGRLIVAGDYHGHGAMLLNNIFGKKYTAVDHSQDDEQSETRDANGKLIWDGSLPSTMNHDALWTKYGRDIFKQGPSKLPAINAVWGLESKSVPQDERMFAHADGVTTVVTMFKYGRGSVFYLGYDWFQDPNNAAWNTVLWSAVDLL